MQSGPQRQHHPPLGAGGGGHQGGRRPHPACLKVICIFTRCEVPEKPPLALIEANVPFHTGAGDTQTGGGDWPEITQLAPMSLPSLASDFD